MPKPDNIVLRNLTGGPTLGPPVKGATSPLISTALPQRDGTRDTGGETGGGGGEVGTPIPPPPVGSDPRWTGPYSPLTPGGSQPGSTLDAAFDFSKFESLGVFVLGNPDDQTATPTGICYAPPHGTNGTKGSLFITTFAGGAGESSIREYIIPETYGDGINDGIYTIASERQQLYDLLKNIDNPDGRFNMTWPLIHNDVLYIYACKYYDVGQGTHTINVWRTDTPYELDLTNWTTHFFRCGDRSPSLDFAAGYTFPIPQGKQSLFGGHTHISGCCPVFSGVNRYSVGHSLYAWSPGNVNPNVTEIPSLEFAGWAGEQDTPAFYKYTVSNGPVREYFDQTVGVNWAGWIQLPNDGTLAPSEYTFTVNNESVVAYDYKGTVACLVNSTLGGCFHDSVVIKDLAGNTLVKDTDYTIRYGDGGYGFGLNHGELLGKVILTFTNSYGATAGDQFTVSYDYLTKRYYDLSYYPQPDVSIATDTSGREASTCFGGMVIPNTDTIILFGQMYGSRFGQGYRDQVIQSQDSTISGGGDGYHPLDFRDTDDYYWSYNINDVLSASIPQQVPLMKYGIFNNNKWDDYGNFLNQDGSTMGAALIGSAYDPANKILYMMYRGMNIPTLNNTYQPSTMIEAYRVNY